MNNKPSTLLKVMGILSIIGAALLLLGSLSMIATGGIIGANFDTIAASSMSSIEINGEPQSLDGQTAAAIGLVGTLSFGIAFLVAGIFWLILGIMAVRGKCGACKGLSYLLIIIDIIGICGGIYFMVVGAGNIFSVLGFVFALIFPILILMGVKQTQQQSAPLQDLRSSN